jgi:hypothetical protein
MKKQSIVASGYQTLQFSVNFIGKIMVIIRENKQGVNAC